MLADSTRSTVAPCSAKYRVAIGPAAPAPNSRIRVPAHAPPAVCAVISGACAPVITGRTGGGDVDVRTTATGRPSTRRSRGPRAGRTRTAPGGSSPGPASGWSRTRYSYSSAVVCRANHSPTTRCTSSTLVVGCGQDVPRRPVAFGQHRIVDQPGDASRATGCGPCRPASRTTPTRPSSARSRGCGRCWRRPTGLRFPAAEPATRRAHVGDEHDLLHRHVDVDRTHARRQRGQRRERDLGRGVRVRGVTGAPHRRAIRIAGAIEVARRGHHAEIGRTPRRPRSRRSERRHT